MRANMPRSYGNAKSDLEFIRALHLRFLHMRKALQDLRILSEQGEEILRDDPETVSDRPSAYIVRSSPFLMLCSMLEGFVIGLAEINCRIEGFKVSPSDFRGSGLERAQAYFKKVADLRFPDQTHEWRELDNLFVARHAIVHSWGRIGNLSKLKRVATLKGFTVSQDGEVWLDSESLPGAIDTVEAFVNQLEEYIGGKQDT